MIVNPGRRIFRQEPSASRLGCSGYECCAVLCPAGEWQGAALCCEERGCGGDSVPGPHL